MKVRIKTFALTILLQAVFALGAQTPYAPERLTVEDYERSEKALRPKASKLVFHADVRPNWIGDHRFWYKNTVPGGSEFILVDAVKQTKRRAFDHERLAAALSKSMDKEYEALKLPFRNIEFAGNGQSIVFSVKGQAYTYDLKKNELRPEEATEQPDWTSTLSPDGTKAVFIREHNLWLRELSSGKEKALTTDGIEDFGYATNNAGWIRIDKPVVLWSPDSRKVATFRHDGRGVSEMHLVTTNVGAPKLESWKYPLPGDSVIFRIHRMIIDTETGKVTRLQMPPDQHRTSFTDHIADWGGNLGDAEWSPDSRQLAFLSNSRDHKEAWLRIADAETGKVRTVIHEKMETFFESGYRQWNWRFLPGRNEVIWYSQRSNWGHLYLYDLKSGALKNPVTQGEWNVLQVREIDRKNGIVYFYGNEKEAGDPYYMYLYRVKTDGSDLSLLTPDPGNHRVSLSPDGNYFVDTWSTPQTPPVSVLRDKNGKKIMDLEKADISRLIKSGWQPPMNFSVKARDGETDLYGLLFKPYHFDPGKKYPVINYIYPGPQGGSVGSRSFSAARGDHQAIANLGFIVVAMDAMGTPMRSKSFHDAYYGNMGDNGLPDQVGGMKQLAGRFPWIDLDRAGIWGHSGGGFASTDAILRYPDFFKVAVSGAGNHDNRNYEDDWGEKWQGLLVTNPDGTTNYDNQANQLLAENLKGKLLLAHGTMDSNVPVYNTLLVVDKLIEANKDFDLLLLPNRGHGFAREPYMMRKRWDYFVKHLLGAEPPREFEFNRDRARP